MLTDLVPLRTFVAVAEEQHLTRAAERLHISVSAASAHVRAVESTLRTQLFVRTNRNLELTRAGQLLFRRAKALLNEATLFTSFALEIHGKVEGQLVIGSDNEPVISRIGQAVAALRSAHPLVQVELHARVTNSARHGLKTGELDLGLLIDPPADQEFVYYQLKTVAFRVAGSLAWKEKIESADWAELARLPWIAPVERSPSYSTMLRTMFESRSLEPDIVARFDNPVLGRAMLDAGVGLMLVREEHVTLGAAEGRIASSPIARAEFPLLLAHLIDRANDPLIRAFVACAHTVWPDMCAASLGAGESGRVP